MIDSLLIIARQVVILFVLMGAGVLMRKTRILQEDTIGGIVNILLVVVTPCLVVDVFRRPFDSSMLMGLGFAFVLAAFVHLALIAFARLVIRHSDEDVRKPLLLSVVFSNCGFMGVPLEQAVLGEIGVFYGVIYIVVSNLFMWSWGLVTMEKGGRDFSLKTVVNPGTVGVALGLLVFCLSLNLPDVIGVPMHHMANLNTPLAMIVIGYGLAGVDFRKVIRIRSIYVTTFVRLIACPFLAIAVIYPFRQTLDRNLVLSTVIAASAPVGATVPMFANMFKRNVDVSVSVVSETTLLSVVTMPIVIAFAIGFL